MNTKWISDFLRSLQVVSLHRIKPEVRRVFPHDANAYTQGLFFHEGCLLESTGLEGRSSLRRVDVSNGDVVTNVSVSSDFAEGLCVHDGVVYQLTWKSGRVLRYKADSLEFLGEKRIRHEGWGIASHAGNLVVSDGTSRLRWYDSKMGLRGGLTVTASGIPFRHLNALCAVGESLYANVWYSHQIVEIDWACGRVRRVIDCTELARMEGLKNVHCILNGIAFDPFKDVFYLTGKFWRNYYEVAWGSG